MDLSRYEKNIGLLIDLSKFSKIIHHYALTASAHIISEALCTRQLTLVV